MSFHSHPAGAPHAGASTGSTDTRSIANGRSIASANPCRLNGQGMDRGSYSGGERCHCHMTQSLLIGWSPGPHQPCDTQGGIYVSDVSSQVKLCPQAAKPALMRSLVLTVSLCSKLMVEDKVLVKVLGRRDECSDCTTVPLSCPALPLSWLDNWTLNNESASRGVARRGGHNTQQVS